MTAQINFIPDGYFSNKDLERLLIELNRIIPQQEVMRIEEAKAFLRVSNTTLHAMCRKGLPFHTLPGLGGKVFLRSELIDFIKKS